MAIKSERNEQNPIQGAIKYCVVDYTWVYEADYPKTVRLADAIEIQYREWIKSGSRDDLAVFTRNIGCILKLDFRTMTLTVTYKHYRHKNNESWSAVSQVARKKVFFYAR